MADDRFRPKIDENFPRTQTNSKTKRDFRNIKAAGNLSARIGVLVRFWVDLYGQYQRSTLFGRDRPISFYIGQDITQPSVFRFVDRLHPASHRQFFKHPQLVALFGEVVGSGQADRPRSDDGDLLRPGRSHLPKWT